MTTPTPMPAEQIQATASQLATAVSQQQMILSEKVGALKATDFIKKLVTVTEIKMLSEIKETKEYKGLQLIDQDGKLVTVTSWEQFCKTLNYSREKIDQDILNLSTFGESFLETSQRMGVGYRDLRKLRKLDDDQQEIIINGEAMQAEDKDSLIDLIEEMSVKHVKDKDQLKQQISELSAKTNAQEKMINTKDNKINQLDTKLNLRKDPSNTHILAEQIEKHLIDQMQQAFSAVSTAIASFNTQVATLKQQAFDEAPQLVDKLDQDISYTYNHIAQLATDEGIDIDLAQLVTPSWMADFELIGQTPEEVEAQQD